MAGGRAESPGEEQRSSRSSVRLGVRGGGASPQHSCECRCCGAGRGGQAAWLLRGRLAPALHKPLLPSPRLWRVESWRDGRSARKRKGNQGGSSMGAGGSPEKGDLGVQRGGHLTAGERGALVRLTWSQCRLSVNLGKAPTSLSFPPHGKAGCRRQSLRGQWRRGTRDHWGPVLGPGGAQNSPPQHVPPCHGLF